MSRQEAVILQRLNGNVTFATDGENAVVPTEQHSQPQLPVAMHKRVHILFGSSLLQLPIWGKVFVSTNISC